MIAWILKIIDNPYRVSQNTAPYLREITPNIALTQGEPLRYQIPDAIDDQNNEVAVTVLLGSAFPFTELDNGAILVNPKKMAVGTHVIKIILTEMKVKKPLSRQYRFTIKIDPAETGSETGNGANDKPPTKNKEQNKLAVEIS